MENFNLNNLNNSIINKDIYIHEILLEKPTKLVFSEIKDDTFIYIDSNKNKYHFSIQLKNIDNIIYLEPNLLLKNIEIIDSSSIFNYENDTKIKTGYYYKSIFLKEKMKLLGQYLKLMKQLDKTINYEMMLHRIIFLINME